MGHPSTTFEYPHGRWCTDWRNISAQRPILAHGYRQSQLLEPKPEHSLAMYLLEGLMYTIWIFVDTAATHDAAGKKQEQGWTIDSYGSRSMQSQYVHSNRPEQKPIPSVIPWGEWH